MEKRQLVVVGASFAGLACARAAALRGVRTTVLDRRSDAGSGVRTTGILVKEAADLWDVPRQLTRKIPGVRLYAPSLQSVDLDRPGYYFLATDTPRLLRWWAGEAQRAGAEIRWGRCFRDARILDTGDLAVSGHGLECSYLVGADGARSTVARSSGLELNVAFLQGLEAECTGIRGVADDRLHVFLNSELAPGYIGWAVPGSGAVQIGLACRGTGRPRLSEFLGKLRSVFDLEGLRIHGYRSGLIPVGGRLRRSACRRILLVGDAAGWVSPLTGGGIHGALEWGRRAGIAVADHLLDGGPDPARVVSKNVPSFAFKRWLRRAFDVPVPDRLVDAALRLRPVRSLARLVFFHHRGVLSRDAWEEWLQHARTQET